MAEGNSTPMGGRQAVLIVHGMGEQRPLDALTGFVRAGLPPSSEGEEHFFSHPDIVTDSFESRRFVARATDTRPQTEFFEYHWAHLMQGNRLGDLWPTIRRLLLKRPREVPEGLRGLWLVFWALIGLCVVALCIAMVGLLPDQWSVPSKFLTGLPVTVLGTGVFAGLLTYLLTWAGKFIPGVLTNSFVDVVRYLDTSPRSYAARHEIRKGLVELLKRLHASNYNGERRYQRVIIVAHSLGAYIAYDGISHLWGSMNNQGDKDATGDPDGLKELAVAADKLRRNGSEESPEKQINDFQTAQYRLWRGLRAHGNPWLISDFITAGTPMYFADLLYTRTHDKFTERVQRHELPTCPPQKNAQSDDAGAENRPYSYPWDGRQVLHDEAPFAAVRWTNLWFPAVKNQRGFFRDYFGGALQPLFGNGIRDIPVEGNLNRGWKRWLPGYAHALYFKFPDDRERGSVTRYLDTYLALEGFRPPPTGKQISYALCLLYRAGFPTTKMDRSHTELLVDGFLAERETVREWLRAMTRPQISALITDLKQREEQPLSVTH
ncbi:hypothetical protein OHT93_19565 [Streptomyces sp. NBC_00191]|uniref:hypothetical protein n=1 Tax=Streptomyces sp. NBC_00191 TaxID=2975674 RepID=UPI0032460EA0